MRDLRRKAARLIGIRLIGRAALLIFPLWLLCAIPVLTASTSVRLVSQADEVFGFELEDWTIQHIRLPDLWGRRVKTPSLEVVRTCDARNGFVGYCLLKIDVDLDGDLDLVALNGVPRFLVWINDGHGHYLLVIPSRHSIAGIRPFFCETAADDSLTLWLEPYELCLESVSFGAVLKERAPSLSISKCCSPRFSRAPPVSLFTV